VKWWREDDQASATLAKHAEETAAARNRRIEEVAMRDSPMLSAVERTERPTREQVEELQRAAARQVYDEWVAAGRPCTPLKRKPLRVRFELAPGFGLSWLSLLALCCELRGGIVDAKGCGLDDG
jgi:hypothetical protein